MRRLVLALCLLAGPLWAVQPDEILDDPALEMRARELSQGLRCLVCRNENIDESDADLARDLRLLVRERLVAGDSNEEAMRFIVARYGEYVLLRPDTSGWNMLLWIAGPLALLGGLGVAGMMIRGRSRAPEPETLSDEEQARLDDLLSR
ncbi:cytochrome c-type biogenesis protein [Profundibacterium mesophilum]|uniref:Cytochrome c-type biogenesis protein n=1 Tax=Profundibacterium mesophilum KAUST100406-0324 TaxID=1037889 RepID=A0A921TCH5_9RHOB|nr:cytochrome c-type biogenesis protein [Profundibacterium mesophilum]KAF0675673.1 Cytochrome c maturation protein CcmH [Profundibacterium mesophilum KAUST100406-0324]